MDKLTFDEDFEQNYFSGKRKKSSKLSIVAFLLVSIGLIICGVLVVNFFKTDKAVAEEKIVLPVTESKTEEVVTYLSVPSVEEKLPSIPAVSENDTKTKIEVSSLTKSDKAQTTTSVTKVKENKTKEQETDPQTLAEALTSTSNTETSQPSIAVISHTVQEGETLESLAETFGVSTETIQAVNEVTTEETSAGVELVIPDQDGYVYKATENESISAIVRKLFLSVSAKELMEINGLISDELHPGQKVFIPNSVSSLSRATAKARILNQDLVKEYKRAKNGK